MRMRATRTFVCGVDEAGRGPWAGPVYAAAVILSMDDPIEGLDDSKKLPARQRETLEVHIKARAVAWAVGSASVEEIDVFNILQATGLAMRRAIESLSVSPTLARVDGNYAFKLPCRVQTVVNGDALHPEISAASILAKTARDRLMVAMDALYPGYGFASHKGYGVQAHADALRNLGPCAIHRSTFKPIRAVAAGRLAEPLAQPLDRVIQD